MDRPVTGAVQAAAIRRRIRIPLRFANVFGSQRCDCRPQLREAAERITKHCGYVLYMRQEGRGIGPYDKLDAYALQDRGLDTYDVNLALGHRADERDYTSAAQMLLAGPAHLGTEAR